MTVLAAVVTVTSFAIAFRLLKLWPVVAEMIAMTRSAAAVMVDGGLDDDIKEREIRTASKRLMGRFVEITARTAVLLAVPAVTLLGFDALGLAPLGRRVPFALGRRPCRYDCHGGRRGAVLVSFESRYSRLDRLLHDLAICRPRRAESRRRGRGPALR